VELVGVTLGIKARIALRPAVEAGLAQAPAPLVGIGRIGAIEVSPDISRIWVETRTALPLECPFIEVSNLDERAGNAEAKLYRRS